MNKKAIILYDSNYGNTEKIAKALGRGLGKQESLIDIKKVDEVETGKLVDYDFLAFGGPTHSLGISKPMKEFLEKIKGINLKGKKAFTFSTKFKAFWAGDAAKGIENILKEYQMSIIKPYSSAIVLGKEGPLQTGAEQTFEQIGVEVAKLL